MKPWMKVILWLFLLALAVFVVTVVITAVVVIRRFLL